MEQKLRNSFIRLPLALALSLCLGFGQLNAAETGSLSLSPSNNYVSTMSIKTSGERLFHMMDLSIRVMLHPLLYRFLNEHFAAPAPDGGEKKSPLSQSKLLYLLNKADDHWDDIEEYLKKVPKDFGKKSDSGEEKASTEKIELIREKFRERFKKFTEDQKLIEEIHRSTALSQPVLLISENSKNAVSNFKFYANHPRFVWGPDGKYKIDSSGRKLVRPPDDHRQVMIDFVNSAEKGDRLYFNFYDFDLPELATAIVTAKNRGVEILGGIDSGVIKAKPGTGKVYQYLKKSKVNVTSVDAVGLNHQKMMSILTKDGQGRVLMSSGNPTQSCSGPEGDLPFVPQDKRPPNSIPNPNHMTTFDGVLPAVVTAIEVIKNATYKLRGQKGFPVGGAYQFLGGPNKESQITQFNKDNSALKSDPREWLILAFSPNGGLGDINRDIYSRLLDQAVGPMGGGFFSISSDEIAVKMIEYLKREILRRRQAGEPLTDLIRVVGDAGFAMRDFSVLLRLTGYRLVEFDPKDPFASPSTSTSEDPAVNPEAPVDDGSEKNGKIKVYVEDKEDALVRSLYELMSPEELKNFRSGIRISPNFFKATSFEWENKNYEVQVKYHLKEIVFPRMGISNVGSSVNLSAAGETNQEQILLIMSHRMAALAKSAQDYWFERVGPQGSIESEVEKRNRRHTPGEIALAVDVLKHRKKSEKKSGVEVRPEELISRSKSLNSNADEPRQCLKVFQAR